MSRPVPTMRVRTCNSGGYRAARSSRRREPMGNTIRLPTMANQKRSRFLSLLLLGAVAAFVSPPVAQASLILTDANGQPANTVAQSFVDIGAQGFGAAPRMLTLQTNTVETGSVTPVEVVHDDSVPGANKSTNPTLATLDWGADGQVVIDVKCD